MTTSSSQHGAPQKPGDYLPQTRLSVAVGHLLNRIEGVISWIWLVLLLVVVLNVILRYLFSEGRIEFEEIQWHLYSVGFLLGLSYCLHYDGHIRVDIVHERLTRRARSWIELYGLLLLFLPFVYLILWAAIPFVAASFANSEVSGAPGGLPLRWLIKAILPLSMVLLALAGIARLSRVSAHLFGVPASVTETQERGDGGGHLEVPR